MNFRLLAISSLLSFVLLGPAVAGAWGLKQEMVETVRGQGSLYVPALRDGVIHYCLQIESRRVKRDSLKIQTERALRVWLNAPGDPRLPATRLEEVSCENEETDLMLTVRNQDPDPRYDYSAYQIQMPRWGRYVQEVYLATERGCGIPDVPDSGTFLLLDSGPWLTSRLSKLGGILDALVNNPSITLESHAKKLKLREGHLFCSIFPILIHEFGHTFGLCDTYGDYPKTQCSARYQTQIHPRAMMKRAHAYALEPDDIAGARAAWELVRSELKM